MSWIQKTAFLTILTLAAVLVMAHHNPNHGGGSGSTCGNNILESGEECDGNEFGGLTCSTYGYNSGSLSCTSLCNIDSSGCFNSGEYCGNGICAGIALGEDCSTCAADCGMETTTVCGDGICHAGEDCNSCALDCNSGTLPGGTCGACHKNKCDGYCDPQREDSSCADCNSGSSYCCGYGYCAVGNCGLGCGSTGPTVSCCGDGTCEGSEDSTNCVVDCPAATGEISIATIEDTYYVNTFVKLTDPPFPFSANPTEVNPKEKSVITITDATSNSYIIKLKEPALLEKKASLDTLREKGSINSAQHNAFLNQHKQTVATEHTQALADLHQKLPTISIDKEFSNVFNGLVATIPPHKLAAIRASPFVKSVTPNLIVSTTLNESIPHIGANQVWSLGYTGAGTTIAVLDTGVDYTHADLGGCFGTGCKVIDGYDFHNNDADPMDDNGHGTHVAATAAGLGLLEGVAKDASLVAYKVLDSTGNGDFANVISAIELAMDPNQDFDYSDHYDVITISLGLVCGNADPTVCGPDDPVSTAVDNAVANGAVVTVAAGNEYFAETIRSPGTARGALTVGATDDTDSLAAFSSRGPTKIGTIKPDVTAPGVGICAARFGTYQPGSLCLDTTHVSISGTSMATPHVAGLAALMLQKNPTWTPEQIKTTIRETAVDLGLLPEEGGWGRIDALSAINTNTPFGVPTLATSGEQMGTIDILGSVTDMSSYTIDYSSDLTNWNVITTTSVPPSNDILASWDTTTLADGDYYLRLTLTNSQSQQSTDLTKLTINNQAMTSPTQNTIFNKVPEIIIDGFVGSTLFDYYELDWGIGKNPASYSTTGVTLTNGGTVPVSGELGRISTAGWNSDFTTIRLRVFLTNAQITQEYVLIYYEQDTLPGFPVSIGAESRSSPAYADINNDGNTEVLIAALDMNVYAFNADGTAVAGWPVSTSNLVDTAVSVGEFDGDPELEISVSDGNALYVWNHDGTPVTGSPHSLPSYAPNYPVFADVDEDGQEELVLGDTNGLVHVFNSDFTEPPGWPADLKPLVTPGEEFTILYPTSTAKTPAGYAISARTRNNQRWLLDNTGTVMTGWPKPGSNFYEVAPEFADVDADGTPEVIHITNDMGVRRISMYALDGTLAYEVTTSSAADSSPSFGDLDGDGDLEIVTSYLSSYLAVYHHDTGIVAGWPKVLPGNVAAIGRATWRTQPLIADVTGDGNPDILKASGLGSLDDLMGIWAYQFDGTPIPGFPKIVGEANDGLNYIYSNPTIGDLDRDGNLDLAVGSKDANLYVWNLNSPNDPSNTHWSTLGNKGTRTGVYTLPKAKSQLVNTGTQELSGRLLIKVQEFTTSWNDVAIIVDGQRTIPTDETLALDVEWVLAGGYTPTTPGSYRVYAALLDGTNAVISNLETTHDFTVI